MKKIELDAKITYIHLLKELNTKVCWNVGKIFKTENKALNFNCLLFMFNWAFQLR